MIYFLFILREIKTTNNEKNFFYKEINVFTSLLCHSVTNLLSKTRDFKVDGCQWNLYFMVKHLFLLYQFYDIFCKRHSLMNQPCYKHLFQFMQHDNFRNLNRVIFTHWKDLESQDNALWFCCLVFKRYTFHYLMKSAPIPGNQSSCEILQLFDIWRYQNLVILFFSSVVTLI